MEAGCIRIGTGLLVNSMDWFAGVAGPLESWCCRTTGRSRGESGSTAGLCSRAPHPNHKAGRESASSAAGGLVITRAKAPARARTPCALNPTPYNMRQFAEIVIARRGYLAGDSVQVVDGLWERFLPRFRNSAIARTGNINWRTSPGPALGLTGGAPWSFENRRSTQAFSASGPLPIWQVGSFRFVILASCSRARASPTE